MIPRILQRVKFFAENEMFVGEFMEPRAKILSRILSRVKILQKMNGLSRTLVQSRVAID